MKVYELTDKGRALLKERNNISYIVDDIEDAYDGAQYLSRINDRNRSLVKWTKLGEIIVHEKAKRSK